jgi:hypothetical protein
MASPDKLAMKKAKEIEKKAAGAVSPPLSHKNHSGEPARRGQTATCALARGAHDGLGLHRQKAFALQLLAGELAGAADSLGLFAGAFLGGLLVMSAQFHFAENSLALHFFLKRFEGLIDIVVADENLHGRSCF